MRLLVLIIFSMLVIVHTTVAQQPAILLQADTGYMDLGDVPYSHHSQIIKYWRIKNICDQTIVAPAVIDVWNDCAIEPGHSRSAPLLPHQSRLVEVHIYTPHREGEYRFCKTGYAEAYISKDSAGHEVKVLTKRYPMRVTGNILPEGIPYYQPASIILKNAQ